SRARCGAWRPWASRSWAPATGGGGGGGGGWGGAGTYRSRATGRGGPGSWPASRGATRVGGGGSAAGARAGGARVWVANLNGPRQVVVSGTVEGVDAVTQDAKLARLKVVRIPVGGAFHTPLMRPAVPLLRRALAAAEFERTDVAVVANVDAGLYTAARWRALAERQLTAPVRWTAVLATLTRLGCTRLVEVGPSRILAKSIGRGDPAPTVRYFGYPGEFAP
ncbi:ACP S-malonyltransferase, partial [Nocardia brasiliensis]|uniref:ACP S-malonyltransferase n=1 Tax=Nocardia brasiliensis TaxID=37326 RepID=UPI003CC805E0